MRGGPQPGWGSPTGPARSPSISLDAAQAATGVLISGHPEV